MMTKTDNNRVKQKPSRSNHALNAEDQSLWDHVTSDVRPLSGTRGQLLKVSLRKKTNKRAEKETTNFKSNTHGQNFDHKQISLIHGFAPGLDKRTKIRLRRGQVEIEAQLDLHGMTQIEANERLTVFLKAAHKNGRRAVLVITGKGSTTDGQMGVLRSMVPQWLNQPSMRKIIKAFDHAAKRDGGEGALYVLLRRRK